MWFLENNLPNDVNRYSGGKKNGRGTGNEVKLDGFSYCRIYQCILNLQERIIVYFLPRVFDHECTKV